MCQYAQAVLKGSTIPLKSSKLDQPVHNKVPNVMMKATAPKKLIKIGCW